MKNWAVCNTPVAFAGVTIFVLLRRFASSSLCSTRLYAPALPSGFRLMLRHSHAPRLRLTQISPGKRTQTFIPCTCRIYHHAFRAHKKSRALYHRVPGIYLRMQDLIQCVQRNQFRIAQAEICINLHVLLLPHRGRGGPEALPVRGRIDAYRYQPGFSCPQ